MQKHQKPSEVNIMFDQEGPIRNQLRKIPRCLLWLVGVLSFVGPLYASYICDPLAPVGTFNACPRPLNNLVNDFGNLVAGKGWGYMQGLGQDQGQGTQDYRQAFYWLNRAAGQKDAGAAQINLGVLYEKGWGVDQDLAKANQLFQQAARSPYPEIANVAKSHLNNRPVAAARSSSKDSDALLGLFVVGLGALAIGALLGGPSSSGHTATSTSSSGTDSSTDDSIHRGNEEATRMLQDSIASENAAREAAAEQRQADRDYWARTQRCGFNANSNCF
jgi:hypothetical protein